MTQRIHRRTFLQGLAIGGIASGLHVSGLPAAPSKSPNEKLNLAHVGVGGKGWDNVQQLASENVVALCDVDANTLAKAADKYPHAKQYRDYRKMLEAERANIDAVTVSTADHTHAPATAMALDLGKPVYCEKPLTHTVREARAVAKLAAKNKLATQMGSQPHSSELYRRVARMIQTGAVGTVKEVHCWCNKGWADGRFQNCDQPAPAHLDWDLWLGPAKQRPYCPNIHPANWRRFWEFGSGTFGDMACHVMGLPFMALNLRNPSTVKCDGPEIHPDGCPAWTKCEYKFVAKGNQPALTFTWSDGGAHFDLVKNTTGRNKKPISDWGLGTLFVGDKGMLAADYGHFEFFPSDKFEGYQPPTDIRPSIGHWKEWVEACKTGSPTICNFDYAAGLTATILLGIVSFRTGKTLEWDDTQGRVLNTAEAEQYLTKEYRKGFEVVGV